MIIGINSEPSLPIIISQKIDELLQELETYAFEEQTLLNLYSYYENSREFAKAENMLSRIASPNATKAHVIDELKSFYKRLLLINPKELAAGGISRTQIQNKLKELE